MSSRSTSKKEIAEVVVSVGPRPAVIIEDAVDRQVAWPEGNDWIRERLPGVVDDVDLVVIMGRTIDRYEAVTVDAGDRVLVHSDVGLHNLALDPETDTRQPAHHLRFADRRMLLRGDAAERPADSLCQFAISLAALEEAPRIATAGNHLADLEAGLRQEKGSRHSK